MSECALVQVHYTGAKERIRKKDITQRLMPPAYRHMSYENSHTKLLERNLYQSKHLAIVIILICILRFENAYGSRDIWFQKSLPTFAQLMGFRNFDEPSHSVISRVG